MLSIKALKKSLKKKGLELPSDKADADDDDEDRRHALGSAYADYVATAEDDSDNESDTSNTSTRPSNESGVKRQKRESVMKAQTSKTHTFNADIDDNIGDQGLNCKLCKNGFALGDKVELFTQNEKDWIASLEEQPKNASWVVFIQQALVFYQTKIRPQSIKEGYDYGEMSYDEMRIHLESHVKTLALERLYQIELSRKMYMLYNQIEIAQVKDKVVDTKSSDQCLKYMNHSHKLLKDKDREEKVKKAILTDPNAR